MPQLDSYLVSLGVKGQEAVLSTMDKIRKGGKNLSKEKTAVSLAAKASGGVGEKITPGKSAAPVKSAADLIKKQTTESGKRNKEDKKTEKQDKHKKEESEKDNGGFKGSINKFSKSTDRFANSAATLNPAHLIQSIASTLPFLGAVAAAGAGALESGKQSTFGAYDLAKRNAATKYYGGDDVKRASMSDAEHASLVMSISSSMGKIGKPLADELNNLVGKKDTGALARVGAGDWESTGTDKGWMLQHIMSGLGDVPPSIRQAIQAQLLKSNADEIQGNEGTVGRQGAATRYSNAGETQTTKLADVAASATFTDANGQVVNSLMALNTSLNTFQVGLVTGAGKLVSAIAMVTDRVNNPKKETTIAERLFK